MKRRNVIKTLFAVPAAILFPRVFKAGDSQKEKKIILMDSVVAGFQYYKGDEIWERMKTIDHLRLVREPKNPFDYDAIEVYRGREKIGYLPRGHNSPIAQMMDRGIKINSKIQRLNKDHITGNRFEVVNSWKHIINIRGKQISAIRKTADIKLNNENTTYCF